MFPLFVKIPITLRITTTTKEMKYDEKDEQETVFPEPPLHPKEVEFSLRRDIHLNARGWKAIDSETITYLGGMGKAASSTLNGNGGVVTTFEKKWTPSANSKHLGFWTQETVMQTVIELKSTPSFSTPILSQRVSTVLHPACGSFVYSFMQSVELLED